jgi:enamine deaminase RidA (YjgF/YER057c/UK114 family)
VFAQQGGGAAQGDTPAVEPERVVRHVVLADIADMAEMDRVYGEFFPKDPPARMAWSMQLRFGNGCEIECVAIAGESSLP